MNTKIESPALSIILITNDRINLLGRTLLALARQTIRDRLELIIVGPTDEDVRDTPPILSLFWGYRTISIGPFVSTAKARAAGVQFAQAPVICFTEDHCFPDTQWAESLLQRHQEKWTGVGAVFQNANPASATSWANYLIEYGLFTSPIGEDFPGQIAGHNSSYKRSVLTKFGDHLAEMLESEAPMQWSLMARGHRFCLEPNAVVFHLNFSRFPHSIRLRFHDGRLFAAYRSKGWSFLRRFVYAAGSPLIPWIRLARILGTTIRIREHNRIPELLPTLLTLLICGATGEWFGYAFGPGETSLYLSDLEFSRDRFLTADDRHQMGDFERYLDQLYER